MKRFGILFFSLFALFCATAFGADAASRPHRTRLVMVTEATFPPYEFRKGAEIVGIDPDIIRAIADELGYELLIEDMSFDSVITAVQSGKADIAASGITVTEDRKQKINFTRPYVRSAQVVIVPRQSPIKSAGDLKGRRIGVQHGTTGDSYVTRHIQEPERYSNGALAVEAMASGKLDAVVLDREPAQVHVSRNTRFQILPEPLTWEEYAFALSKRNPKLLADINAALLKLQTSGKIEEIKARYTGKKTDIQIAPDFKSGGRFGAIRQALYVNFVKDQRYMYLLNGFLVTMEISACAVLLGIAIGFTVAVIRSTADKTGGLPVLNFLCKVYLTVIRGTPVVVQLLIIYFVIFGAMNVDKVLVAIVAFGVNSGAYVAEIIRGGIMSIDKGQMEAARSLGLGYGQSMVRIILPQAFKNVLPALGNEFIVLLKETSVSGYIALQDLTKAGDIIRSQTYDAFLPLMAVAAIYLGVVTLFSALLTRLEGRLKNNE